MKLIVTSELWLKYARDNKINWTYHTVDEHPIGRVEFTPKARPDVRATLVKKGVVSLEGLSTRGKFIVCEMMPRELETLTRDGLLGPRLDG